MTENTRPGIIATKAVNQYRGRDAFAYLGLRHLLKSVVSRSDQWATRVAVDQIVRRSEPSYYVSEHFKERLSSGENSYRKIAIPGPIEIIAESALLTECARYREFDSHSSVFTYHLSDPSDRSGIYKNYMDGLRSRHRAIESACLQSQNFVVKFLDLKKFYPSIRTEDVKSAWDKYAGVLPRTYQDLGDKLIRDHQLFSVDGSRGLLTGPMFSHFAANLVMKEVDVWAATELGVKYCRYVDDITLVGEDSLVKLAAKKLAERLKSLELTFHDENSSKTIEIGASEWLIGKSDFEHDFGDVTWGRFVSDIKSFLVLNPEKSGDLTNALEVSGARLPILDYSSSVREAKFSDSLYRRARRSAFRISASALTVNSIVAAGRKLKEKMELEVRPLLDDLQKATGFSKKRLIPKLRFRIGRLAYLSDAPILSSFYAAATGVDELALQREVISATVSGDLSYIVSMGANASQAASQPLVASKRPISMSVDRLGPVELQGVAAAVLNGVQVKNLGSDSRDEGILDLSRGLGLSALRKSKSGFISEVSFLVGKADEHQDLLTSAFDEDERLTFDAVERFEESAPQII